MTTPVSSDRLRKTVLLGGQPTHRIALAPLTRLRNVPQEQVPTDLAATYYSQRASKDGLLITEGTFIAKEAGGYPYAPGIYSDDQVDAWKAVTAGVHAKGGRIFTQLWALGRAHCDPPLHDHMSDVRTVAPSAGTSLKDGFEPVELTADDIQRFIGHYKQAASNANVAGFDGIEIHGANGYLIDQFLQSNSNKRTDAWGGSFENRARFLFEAVGAAVDAIGQERVGVRFSPWGTFQGMGETNPYEIFSFAIKTLTERFPKLAYIHLVEPREWAPGSAERDHLESGLQPSNDRFRAIVRGIDPASVGDGETFVFPVPTPERPTVFLSAGGYTPDNIVDHVERTGDVIAIGRHFIANPDLPRRIFNNLPLNAYHRETFYEPHDGKGSAGVGAKGYVDYAEYVDVKA